MDNNNAPVCSCKHHKVVPILVILFGLAFLLEAFGALSMTVVNIVWPILVIIAGVAKLCKCCAK